MSKLEQPIGELNFEIDHRGPRLVFRGPQTGPRSARVAVAVTRDGQGRYRFTVGGTHYAYLPSQLPTELRRMLDSARSSPPGPVGLVPLRLPAPSQMKLASGDYMSFRQFENARLEAGTRQLMWSALPQPVYVALVNFYQTLGPRAELFPTVSSPP